MTTQRFIDEVREMYGSLKTYIEEQRIRLYSKYSD